MDQKARAQAWDQNVAAWREAHDDAYAVARAHSKLFEGVVARLRDAGIDIQPLFEQLRADLEKVTGPRGKER